MRYTARNLPFGLLLTIFLVIGARGTLWRGPPLRWGDACFSDCAAANQLALNGIFTLSRTIAAKELNSRASAWIKTMPADRALAVTRDLVLQSGDRLLVPAEYSLLRVPGESPRAVQFSPRPRNLVIILMESFWASSSARWALPTTLPPVLISSAKRACCLITFFHRAPIPTRGFLPRSGAPQPPRL